MSEFSFRPRLRNPNRWRPFAGGAAALLAVAALSGCAKNPEADRAEVNGQIKSGAVDLAQRLLDRQAHPLPGDVTFPDGTGDESSSMLSFVHNVGSEANGTRGQYSFILQFDAPRGSEPDTSRLEAVSLGAGMLHGNTSGPNYSIGIQGNGAGIWDITRTADSPNFRPELFTTEVDEAKSRDLPADMIVQEATPDNVEDLIREAEQLLADSRTDAVRVPSN